MNSDTRNSSGLMWSVSASPRMTTAAVPGSRPASVGQGVRQHPHRRCARGVVENRERDRGDQPHRHDRRPAALSQPGVEGLDPRVGDKAVEPPAGGAHQQQREQRADRAGDDRDARCRARGPNSRPGGQRERGAREREHGDDDVCGQEGQREPRPDRRRPVPQLHGGRPRHQQQRLRRESQSWPSIAANWRRGTCFAVEITAARSAARVLTTDFTATKTTGRRVITRPVPVASRLPGARWPDGDHLA